MASGAPRFFDSLRKQILVQLAASSLLHFLLQSEPSRQELRNRLQFPPAKLNLQRNTNPPTLHATAGIQHPVAGGCTSKTSRWGTGGFDTKQTACLAVNISKQAALALGTTDVGSPATAHQRTIRPLGAVNNTDTGRADAAAEPAVALTARLLTSAQHRWRGRWQQPRGRARR